MSSGIASYDATNHRLEVIRPGESTTRYIPCQNITASMRVFGVQVEGDEIWVLVGPQGNLRPNRKVVYRFSSLSGGGSSSL